MAGQASALTEGQPRVQGRVAPQAPWGDVVRGRVVVQAPRWTAGLLPVQGLGPAQSPQSLEGLPGRVAPHVWPRAQVRWLAQGQQQGTRSALALVGLRALTPGRAVQPLGRRWVSTLGLEPAGVVGTSSLDQPPRQVSPGQALPPRPLWVWGQPLPPRPLWVWGQAIPPRPLWVWGHYHHPHPP